MMMIPFPVGEGEFNVFVILEPENLRRMADNDPAQLNVWKLPEPWSGMRLRDVIMSAPSAEDIAIARKLVEAGQGGNALEYLSRGFKFKPKEGDNDFPYQPQGAPQ